jgi:hypothetical protein
VEVARVAVKGLWPVSETCLAKNHNSLSAARARYSPTPCVCEHALELKRVWDEEREARAAVRRAETANARFTKIKLPGTAPRPIESLTYPDFTGGVCTTPHGRHTAQEGMNDQPSREGIRVRERAKALCNAGPCPIRDTVCRPWVMKEESPPGSWGGVWGGWDAWNRRGQKLVIVDGHGQAGVIPYVVN